MWSHDQTYFLNHDFCIRFMSKKAQMVSKGLTRYILFNSNAIGILECYVFTEVNNFWNSKTFLSIKV